MTRLVIEDREGLILAVSKAKQGDKEAFSQIFEAFYAPLYRYSLNRLKDKEHAEDLVSKVFLKFYENLDKFELISLKSYLFTIALREIINHNNKKSFELLPDDLDVVDESVTPEAGFDQKLTNEELIKAVDSLNGLYKEVIYLHYFAELSHEEISETLKISEANVRKLKSRGIAKLKLLLASPN